MSGGDIRDGEVIRGGDVKGRGVRAGEYAVWRGDVFEYEVWGSRYFLFRSGLLPCPEGFTANPQRGWVREVDPIKIDSLFHIKTEAVWQGHRVEVERVRDDEATLRGWSLPGQLPDHPSVDEGELSGEWKATVPVWELTEAVETILDGRP